MVGKCIILVGMTGTGKTTWLKNKLKGVNPSRVHLFDINNEYTDVYKKTFVPFEKFAEISSTKINSVLVYDEATIFLNNRKCNQTLIDVLVRKRHAKNTIFLCFHSLRLIPRYIFDLSNYVVLFKTNDPETLAENKFENAQLFEAFRQIKNAPYLKASNGKEYSPHIVVTLQ